MQAEILEQNPEADIVVYTVWFNMLPTDSRSAWEPTLMPDPRVSHFWDKERVIGRWFSDNVGFSHGSIAWDVYYLFGDEAVWDEIPDPFVSSGYTLFGQRSQLVDDLDILITQ